MTISINGTTGISGVDGSASTPALQGSDSNTGVFFDTDTVTIATGGTAAVTVDSGQRTKFPTTIGVGGATPSTSGSEISFPATQSASTDANTLDDYEEGTWTPSAYAAISGSLTSYTSSGIYTKIGRTVIATASFKITDVGTATTGLLTSGYPFTSNNLSTPGDGFVSIYRENAITGNTGGSTLSKNATTGALLATLGTNYVFEWTMVYQT